MAVCENCDEVARRWTRATWAFSRCRSEWRRSRSVSHTVWCDTADAGKSRRNLGGRLEEVCADEGPTSWCPVESSAMIESVNLGDRDWWCGKTKWFARYKIYGK